MTAQEQIWFNDLYQIRNNDATTLMKTFSMRNMWKSIVEKYSGQAHFIYELLQNSDDAKATESSFELTIHGLYFRHNGKRLFGISNPAIEEEDQQNNRLGDINAITAVAQSNKEDHSIGKFGVGFKAVFQYTETPHIYDPNFQFKIRNFIVPEQLPKDLPNRKKDETVFYFPFDKKEKMPAETAYSDILEKLKKLVYPTLFLSNLQKVEWKAINETGEYTKKILKSKEVNNITYEEIELYQQIGQQKIKEKLYLFSRFTEESKLRYSIGYFLNEERKLIPKVFPAFCFFPTKEATNLNFIVHAPFLLNHSREGILRSQKHNEEMVELLAELAADSLLILKDLKLIDDNIINIIPYKEPQKDDLFAPFYSEIKEKLQTQELLPAKGGTFASKDNAYWAVSPEITELFSNQQLAQLVSDANAKWVFSSISRTESTEIRDYIDGGSERVWEKKEANLIKAHLDFETIIKLITPGFINVQSNNWLHIFYEYLAERESYHKFCKTTAIFKDTNANAVPAFAQQGKDFHEILFLPSGTLNTTYRTIHPNLLKNGKSKDFFKKFGIKEPNEKDVIYNVILPLYEGEVGVVDKKAHFIMFFNYWKKYGCPEDFITLIKDCFFISCKTIKDEITSYGYGKGNEIYYPSKKLEEYFETKPSTYFVDLPSYSDKIGEQDLKDFLLKLGVSELPRISNEEITCELKKQNLGLKESSRGYSYRNTTTDVIIDGCKEILTEIITKEDADKSVLLWNYLGELQINMGDILN